MLAMHTLTSDAKQHLNEWHLNFQAIIVIVIISTRHQEAQNIVTGSRVSYAGLCNKYSLHVFVVPFI